MKLECVKDKLLDAISKAEKIVGKNLTLPVLSYLMLEAKDNFLKVIATNLNLGIEIDIPINLKEEGKIAVLGGVLNGLVAGDLKSNKVSLETLGDTLKVVTDNNSAILKSCESGDFPTIPKLDDKKHFLIDSKKLMKGLKSVWYSSSTSNIKPELSSVLVYLENNDLVFVATDSFRLAEIKVDGGGIKDFGSILIPFDSIPEILGVFDNSEGNMKIYLTKNQIAFEYNNIYLTSRIIDGNFPDYQQLIPKDFKTEITLLKEDFLASLKVSNIFSDKFNKVVFDIDPQNKKFEIISKNNDVGETNNRIDSVMEGAPVSINFNQKYIMDCFQSINTDSISLKFNGLNKPMVIRSVPDAHFTYLVMPMNN